MVWLIMKMDFSQPCPPASSIQDLEGAFEQLWELCHKLLLKVNVLETQHQAREEEWTLKYNTVVAENARLKEKIDDLNGQLRLNSKNSSKPPSSDYPSGKPPSGGNTGCSAKGRIRVPSRDEKKRKQGGQPGHKGHCRKLLAYSHAFDHLLAKHSITDFHRCRSPILILFDHF